MVKKALKRKISSTGEEFDRGEEAGKKTAILDGKKAKNNESSDEVIKEFIKLVNVKQTRLKGLNKFLKAVREAETKCEIILKYLQTHPDCLELFQVLDERIEERSLFEVQRVLEILEIIILYLADEDVRSKSKSTVIITKLFTKHRKLVYNLLNSSCPAKVVTAMLKLLTAIVMQGSSVGKELLTAFDFSHKTFGTLINRRDKKAVTDVRTCFIKFLLSFFIGGDPSLIQQVLQIKGFATSIFKNLHTDSPEVIHLVLSTFLVKVVQNSSLLKKTKILLFTSYALLQLVKLYSYDQDSLSVQDMSVRDRIHHFLLELCTSQGGIAFENKLGMFSPRSNNPVLLRFLHSLPKTLRDELLVELVIKILINSQDLISPYLSDCQMALEPRNSEQWSKNYFFLIKLYFLLPLPSSILENSSVSPDRTPHFKYLLLVCPIIIKRNILTRGLMHSDVVVQTTSLTMVLVILRRAINLTRCVKVVPNILVTFREDILKILPSFQTLISVRESLLGKTKTVNEVRGRDDEGVEKDSSPSISVQEAKLLLSRTLLAMNLYQILSPNSFTQVAYDPWKLLPRSEDEQPLYNLSSEHTMLQVLLNSPSRNFKNNLQSKTESFQGIYQILELYCNTKDASIQSLAREIVKKLLIETGVFDENNEEILLWLRNMLDVSIETKNSVVKFFEKVYCLVANDPFDLVDTVTESVNVLTVGEQYHLAPFKNFSKRAMPFSPLVAGALKLFSHMIRNMDEQVENMTRDLDLVARYLNLVFLDILASQADPSPLCNIVSKYLVEDDLVCRSLPGHTRAFLLYLGQWCPEVKERISNDDGRTSAEKYLWNLKKKQGSLQKRGYLSLSSIQFKEQLPRILEPWISGERSDEFNFLVTYLRCNPVSLFDCLGSAEFVMVLNALPCSLVIQQLLMYVLKYWKSDIADTVALWSTFEQLSVAVLSSAKHENTEHWNQTVPACLFLVHNLIQLYLNDPRNQRVFNEIHRIITEVLRTVLRCIIENRDKEPKQSLSSTASSGSDVRHEHDDVMCAVDDVCELREGLQNQDSFLDCVKMVFGDFVFKEWFYCHVDGQKDEAQFAMDYVSSVVSDCVAYLLSGLREEILADKDHELWKPYFLRIANAVKLEAVNKQDVDTDLPFNVGVTSLLKLFCDQIPLSSLNETILAFLDIPQEQFVEDVVPMDTNETSEEQGNRLTVKGKTFVTLLDCFLSKERTCPEISVPVALERIFQLLIWLDCEETDELTAKSVPVFSSLSDEINVSVLHKCLDHPTPARIETAVILLSDRPSLVQQLEQYLVNHSKGTENETDVHVSTKDEAQFLGVDSQWEAFLPLVNFYLSSVIREDEAPRSQRTQSCVKYIGQVSWPKLKAWLVGTKSVKCANEYFQVVFRLLEVEELDNDALQKLFNDVTKREHSLNWDLFQVQAIESLLQSILKQSSKGKEKKKYRTSFVFACMERLTALLKSHRLQGDDSLRWKILCFLESYGKGPLKFKKIDNFTSEDLMNASNAFIKSALRFGFSCAQTLGVLSVIVQSVYECDSKKTSLLVPLTDLYQFILSHSKFLEIFLGNAENGDCKTSKTKCALIDLLQTVVDLEPKCCNPSHLSLILGAYSSKLGLTDKKLLRLLFTYEVNVGELATGSRVLWGEAAIEAYQANKDGPATLWHQPSLDQVLDLLDSKLLLQSANHFPIHKQLQPVSAHDGQNSQLYDPSFLLPLFSFFLAPGCEVNCRRFVDRSALAYTISALTSTDKQMRQVAYQILSRFVVHLSGSRFKEQQQVSHLLHCFQNGIMEANSRVSSLITSFMARALHIFFYPEDPLYMSVNSYMLQKAFMDLRDVPLFLSLINSSDLAYRTERTWLVHLLIDGLRDSMDYYICKKYHVFQQLFSLYSCSIADKHLQNLILKVIRQVCRLHAPVYDLCHNYGLVPWLHLLVSNHSTSPDAFQMVLGILGLIWFTLIGEEVSRDDHHTGSRELNRKDESKGHPLPLPKNICPELLLVCLSVLQRDVSLEIWNTDTFVAFARLMESLLNHQNTNPPPTTVVIQKHHATQLTRIWNLIFGDIDILDQLIASFKRDSNFTNNPCVLTTEKWFCSMSSVIHIKNSSQIQELSDNQESNVKLYSCLSRPVSRHVEVFLETKLHRALRGFTEVSDTEGGREGFGDCSSLKRFVDLIFKNSLM